MPQLESSLSRGERSHMPQLRHDRAKKNKYEKKESLPNPTPWGPMAPNCCHQLELDIARKCPSVCRGPNPDSSFTCVALTSMGIYKPWPLASLQYAQPNVKSLGEHQVQTPMWVPPSRLQQQKSKERTFPVLKAHQAAASTLSFLIVDH